MTFWTSSSEALLRGGGGTPVVGVTGLVGTDGAEPNATLNSSQGFMTRKGHYARGTSPTIAFVYPNWYINSANGVLGGESGTGNSVTVKAWIEYPNGVYTPVTFNNGSSSITIAQSTTVISDAMPVAIPDGTAYFSWTFVQGSGGNLVPQKLINGITNNLLCVSCGEASHHGASTPTTPGAITDNSLGQQGYFPLGIVGTTTLPSVCIIGDSRSEADHDIADSSYDLGDVARSIGPRYAYSNIALSGDRLTSYYFRSTLRNAFISTYCTMVINEYGVNDLAFGGDAAQFQTMDQQTAARWGSKIYVRTTKEPESGSTDSWATVGNQTASNATAINNFNNWARGQSIPFVELSDPMSSAHNSGKWISNGTPFFYTVDGIHESQGGQLYLQGTGAVNPVALGTNLPLITAYPTSTLTAEGTPSYGSGRFDQAISGGGGLIYGFASGTPPATLECWVNSASASGSNMVSCYTGSLGIFAQATTCNAGIWNTTTNTPLFSTTSVCDGAWHHLAATADTSSVYTLYVDGVASATYTNSISATNWAANVALQVRFDESISGSPVAFPGSVDEVASWNILKYTGNFTPPSSPYVGNEAGLVGVWHLDGDLTGTRGPSGL